MTEIEQIKEEIKRLLELNKGFKKDWRCKFSFFHWCLLGRIETLEGLLNFIKSLEKKN